VSDPWAARDSDLPPTLSDRFIHILSAANDIDEWLRELSKQQLAHDQTLRLALERALEIIGVATDHIPADLKETEVAADWKALADLSRRLEVASERIEPEVLWDFAQHKLVPLKELARRYAEA
jgi:uncharacterized protein with HEPN domain